MAAVRVSPEATVAMSTHTSITTSVEDNTACTNDIFSNQYSQQHSATPYHACIAKAWLRKHPSQRKLALQAECAPKTESALQKRRHDVCMLSREIAILLRVSGVSGIYRLLTLPDIQSHMVLWKHVVATTEGLASLKHYQSTV